MQDGEADAAEVLFHLVVPEAQCLEAPGFKMPVAHGVSYRARMLPAIDLHDQPRLEADEVEDVAVKRHLPPELQASEFLITQRLPQKVFGLRRVGPHGPGKGAVRRRNSLVYGVQAPGLTG